VEHNISGMQRRMRTVLIVEDDHLFRKALATFLTSLGFEANGVSTAEEALREASWSNVDLVLIDYYLPGMNGIELARSLQARHLRARMFLMSGYLPEAVRQEARAASIELVLCKPHDMTSLAKALEHALSDEEKRHAHQLPVA
jgi:two-component system, cell cycle sensor histidine kinase and response regulator CckA